MWLHETSPVFTTNLILHFLLISIVEEAVDKLISLNENPLNDITPSEPRLETNEGLPPVSSIPSPWLLSHADINNPNSKTSSSHDQHPVNQSRFLTTSSHDKHPVTQSRFQTSSSQDQHPVTQSRFQTSSSHDQHPVTQSRFQTSSSQDQHPVTQSRFLTTSSHDQHPVTQSRFLTTSSHDQHPVTQSRFLTTSSHDQHPVTQSRFLTTSSHNQRPVIHSRGFETHSDLWPNLQLSLNQWPTFHQGSSPRQPRSSYHHDRITVSSSPDNQLTRKINRDEMVSNKGSMDQSGQRKDEQEKKLIMLRGLPGSGKTTLAKQVILQTEP